MKIEGLFDNCPVVVDHVAEITPGALSAVPQKTLASLCSKRQIVGQVSLLKGQIAGVYPNNTKFMSIITAPLFLLPFYC